MTTINLYQNQNEESGKLSFWSGNKGLFFSLGIIILTILILFGFKAAIIALEKRNQSTVADIQTENSSLVGLSNLELVMDMQNRLSHIKNNLKIDGNAVLRTEMTKGLDSLENDSISGAAVSSYKFQDEKVTISFIASNFSDIARQILNFKNSGYFANANVTSVNREEKGITCVVEMDIKK